MAAAAGPASADLMPAGAPAGAVERLLAEPRRFAFFQAVRLLEQAAPGAAPVGGAGPPEREAIRFHALPSLGFPPADLAGVEPGTIPTTGAPRWHMTVTFLGLIGPASPLPAHFTENLLRGDEDRSHNVLQFLDLFNHRFTALFYRCWVKYRHAVRYRPDADDELSGHVFALAGLGPRPLRETEGIEWPRLLPLVGLLGMRRRSAAVVERILAAYFDDVPVRIRQWIERRAPVPAEQQARLGLGACTLGRDALAGRSVPDLSGRFRVVLGPLDRAAFESFLPGAPRHAVLCRLLRLVADDHLQADIALVLARSEAPGLSLGRDGGRLGWSNWLGRPREGDPEVVVPADIPATPTTAN